MKLKNQVVSLEPAKKLKKLGVKQKSLFWWHNREVYFEDISDGTSTGLLSKKERENQCYSAFTVAELGEMLPEFVEIVRQITGDFRGCIYDKYSDCEECGTQHYSIIDKTLSKTEADARAKMLIYLIENKLL